MNLPGRWKLAKDKTAPEGDWIDQATDDAAPAPAPAPDPGPPVPFVVPPPQNPPPTEAQLGWMAAHPEYVRISHQVLGRFDQTGTLTPDGSFISISQSPIQDGAGSFGIGISR